MLLCQSLHFASQARVVGDCHDALQVHLVFGVAFTDLCMASSWGKFFSGESNAFTWPVAEVGCQPAPRLRYAITRSQMLRSRSIKQQPGVLPAGILAPHPNHRAPCPHANKAVRTPYYAHPSSHPQGKRGLVHPARYQCAVKVKLSYCSERRPSASEAR